MTICGSLDRGMFSAVLYAVALFQGLAVLAALRVGHARVETAAARALQSPEDWCRTRR